MESTANETAVMQAHVLQVCPDELLVCDLCACQQVLVHTPDACCFRPGERICIEYSGAMTRSLPPQITAGCIRRMDGCC